METKKWKECVLEIVKSISDKTFQEKAWFGLGDVISSPEEFYCTLFDDYMYDDFLKSSHIDMTSRQRNLGVQLKNKLNEYSKNMDEFPDPKVIIEDPDWDEVRKAAQKFLQSF